MPEPRRGGAESSRLPSLPGSRVPDSRRRQLNQGAVNPGGRFILYWMTAARRTTWNFALERAADWARHLGRPLVVLEALRAGYPWASDRHHAFIVRGMAENARRLRARGVTAYPYLEPAPGAGRGLLTALAAGAGLVVTDDAPVFFLGRMTSAAAGRVPVLVEGVDGNGLLPLAATEKIYPTAASFRRFLHKVLPRHLEELPTVDPLRRLPRQAPPGLAAISRRWPPLTAAAAGDPLDAVAGLPIDHGVPAIEGEGGALLAVRRWRAFRRGRLADYGQSGRRTLDHPTSGLSAYLHHGHISVHQIAAEIFKSHAWSPARINSGSAGSREGWWGLPAPIESFLDQLVTWRELGFNMAHHHRAPESYASLPGWARDTMERHAGDPRPHLYTRRQLEAARTHDELWNAAQRQLVQDGSIHNYMRMLWGKKILEWSASPRQALATMIHLNHKYALDGRDPNSASGILWILGRYDRPWGPERPIFGRIRYMSSSNTARKMNVKDYLRRHLPT